MWVIYVYLGLVIPAHNDSEQISAVLHCIFGQKLKNAALCLEMFFRVLKYLNQLIFSIWRLESYKCNPQDKLQLGKRNKSRMVSSVY